MVRKLSANDCSLFNCRDQDAQLADDEWFAALIAVAMTTCED